MTNRLSNRYVVADILAEDEGRNRGLTIGRYHILLSLDKKSRANFLDLLEEVKGTRNRLKKDIEWLLIKHLINRETFRKTETFNISEKGRFLLVLLREYEDGAGAAEANQDVITPLIERIRSTSVPIAKYLEEFVSEYENVAQRLQHRAQLIREAIKREYEEEG